MKIVKQNKEAISEAIKFLDNGGIIVCPTDTVYGFLADVGNKKAVEKIYKIKKRAKSKPLPNFVKDFKMATKLAEINEKQEKVLRAKWPGKYTFVLNKKSLPAGRQGTIALRVPDYKFLNDLLKRINKPLAQTSVNISGNPPLIKICDIIEQFFKFDILIIDGGELERSKPSKIIDLTSNGINILRK